VTQVNSNFSYTNSAYLHREVIDIRTGSEFIFRVPYVSPTPYKRCDPTFFGAITNTDAGNTTLGSIGIHVVDALKASSQVSSSITVLVETCAGDDIEFAQPRNTNIQPLYNATPQMNVENDGKAIHVGDIGASSCSHDPVASASVCIGEKIRNFRFMLKNINALSLTTVTNFAAAKYMDVLPFSINVYTTGTTVDSVPLVNSDLYGLLGSIYLFSRGGIRMKTVQSSFGTTMVNASVRSVRSANVMPDMFSGNSTPIGSTDSWLNRNQCPQQYSQAGVNASTEFCVPMYNMTHSRVNPEYVMDGTTPFMSSTTGNDSNTNLLTYAFFTTADLAGTTFFRSGADDCNFGCFTSIPPMTVGTATPPKQ
jgi:hypothetical protein